MGIINNENTQQEERNGKVVTSLNRLQKIMVELEQVGIDVSIAPAYGTHRPATFIIVENTRLENGKIRSLEC